MSFRCIMFAFEIVVIALKKIHMKNNAVKFSRNLSRVHPSYPSCTPQKAKMTKTLEVAQQNMNTIRTGRANVNMLDRIVVRPK